MDEQTVSTVLSSKRGTNSNLSGIGIGNVRDRIQLCYGENFGLKLNSNLGVGTTVTIIIPACELNGEKLMYKVLIADDEQAVRIGMRSFIDWNKNGFELVGEAKDGRAARSDSANPARYCDHRFKDARNGWCGINQGSERRRFPRKSSCPKQLQ